VSAKKASPSFNQGKYLMNRGTCLKASAKDLSFFILPASTLSVSIGEYNNP